VNGDRGVLQDEETIRKRRALDAYIRPHIRRFSWIMMSATISMWRFLRGQKLAVHCSHDKSYLHGIRCACKMRVDLL
jgi:hypothetical protein